MSYFTLFDAPVEGSLDAVNVPLLLAQAWRDQRSGILELRHGQNERSIDVFEGTPYGFASTGVQDRFAEFLLGTRRLDAAARLEVERFAEKRSCPQAAAVLALKFLDAKALYQALREEARRGIAETFEWNAGKYTWRPERAYSAARPASAKAFDLISLLQEELPRRWGTDRLFRELMHVQDAKGDISPRFRKVANKLASAGAPAENAIRKLDEHLPIGRILGECAGEPLAAATLWAALHTGVVRLGASGPSLRNDPTAFEVEVFEATTAFPADDDSKENADSKSKTNAQESALRNEIENLLGNLGSLDHYSALGLDEAASTIQIKKAYFKAAKKYHPDALARLGLDDLKGPAAQVFARIAEAFETLSDADKRKAYDAGDSGEPEIDTARLAQAETSFRKGEILAKMGNFEGALEYLEPAVELWPDEPAYQAALGWALYKKPKANAERAAEHLGLALSRSQEDAVTHFRLGLVMRAIGKIDLANELIARARTIEPSVKQ